MTARRTSQVQNRTDRPAPTADLFRRPLTQWYAEWKARKAAASTRPVVTAPTSGSGRVG